jgi:hypothetical protein
MDPDVLFLFKQKGKEEDVGIEKENENENENDSRFSFYSFLFLHSFPSLFLMETKGKNVKRGQGRNRKKWKMNRFRIDYFLFPVSYQSSLPFFSCEKKGKEKKTNSAINNFPVGRIFLFFHKIPSTSLRLFLGRKRREGRSCTRHYLFSRMFSP